jgi:hypothetical protein
LNMRSLFSSLFTKLPNSPRIYFAVVLLLVMVASPDLPAQNPEPASPAPAAQAPSQHTTDQSATIRGVVLSTVDKKPIPGVQVTIFETDRAAMTDDKGQFAFTAIPFGYVTVKAEKSGFLCVLNSRVQPNCSQGVDLRSNDGDVTLTMTPQGIVTGRIVDSTGEPIANMQVSLMCRDIDDGLFDWTTCTPWATMGTAKTNAKGVFRMTGLEPNAYLLRTSDVPDPQPRNPAPEADHHGYAATYYSGTTDQSAAKPLVIHAGEELKADLTVRHEKFQAVTVAYAWNHPWSTGHPGHGFSGSGRRGHFNSSWDETQHLFRAYLPAGTYNLDFVIYPRNDPKSGKLLPWPGGTTRPYMGSVEFVVKDRPVTLTGIPSQQPISIPLHIHVQLTQRERREAKARNDYQALFAPTTYELKGDGWQYHNPQTWGPEGKPSDFQFKDIPPGRYLFGAYVRRYSYVASVTCGSLNLLRVPLVVGPGVPRCSIEVVIRGGSSSLTSGLTPEAKAKLIAAKITETQVARVSVEKTLVEPLSFGIYPAFEPFPDTIPPGKYLAFLFNGRAIAWRDPEERKRLISLGTVVTLAPGQSKTVLLDLLPGQNPCNLQSWSSFAPCLER